LDAAEPLGDIPTAKGPSTHGVEKAAKGRTEFRLSIIGQEAKEGLLSIESYMAAAKPPLT
jgi:hypothetical protein